MQGIDSNGIVSRNYSYNWGPYKEPVQANETEPSISSFPSKHTQSKVQFGWEELAGGKSAVLEFENLMKERWFLKKYNPGSFKRNVLVLRLLFISKWHVLTYLLAVSSQLGFFFLFEKLLFTNQDMRFIVKGVDISIKNKSKSLSTEVSWFTGNYVQAGAIIPRRKVTPLINNHWQYRKQ